MTEKTIRPVPAIQCYLAYTFALTTGITSWIILHPHLTNQLIVGLISTGTATIVIWFFSIANGNSSIYDPYWVIAPPILSLAFLISSGMYSAVKILIVLLFWIWSFRYHLFYSWTGWRTGLTEEDWRYENMRRFPLPYWLNSLLGMHLFPTVLVYSAFLPAAMILSKANAASSRFTVWDFIGAGIAITAICLEFFSDRQLSRFRETDEYRDGETMRSGLWKYSRHPNYFGEVLFWMSFIVFAHSRGLLIAHPFLVLTGPLSMAVFFRFSAWLTDKRSLKNRHGYQLVIDETSALIPWFPRKKNRM